MNVGWMNFVRKWPIKKTQRYLKILKDTHRYSKHLWKNVNVVSLCNLFMDNNFQTPLNSTNWGTMPDSSPEYLRDRGVMPIYDLQEVVVDGKQDRQLPLYPEMNTQTMYPTKSRLHLTSISTVLGSFYFGYDMLLLQKPFWWSSLRSSLTRMRISWKPTEKP